MVSMRMENFGGMVPLLSPRLLPENMAANAVNAYLRTGEMRGLREPTANARRCAPPRAAAVAAASGGSGICPALPALPQLRLSRRRQPPRIHFLRIDIEPWPTRPTPSPRTKTT